MQSTNQPPEIAKQLHDYETMLRNAKKLTPLASKNWAVNIPNEAGVYVIWEGKEPKYVGQTSSLKHRMRDLARANSHCFTRKTAALLKIAESEIQKIQKAIYSKYKLSYVSVQFGRTEIEE